MAKPIFTEYVCNVLGFWGRVLETKQLLQASKYKVGQMVLRDMEVRECGAEVGLAMFMKAVSEEGRDESLIEMHLSEIQNTFTIKNNYLFTQAVQ